MFFKKFGKSYDVHEVKISTTQRPKVSEQKLTLTIVPGAVSGDYVRSKVEEKGISQIVTCFCSSTMTKVEGKNTDSLSCLAMFEALQLKAQPQEANSYLWFGAQSFYPKI